MADPTTILASGGPPPSDTTFRKYTATQAASYQAGRSAYSDVPTQTILSHHTSTGGQLTTLLDVGCGPGTATRSFAPHFARSFGVDPAVEMINAARVIPSTTTTTPALTFALSTAEEIPGTELASSLPPGSVDLLTAAMAAHWFDMSRFWPWAAALLKPGGTVALWTGASFYCHPHTTPNAAQVQAVLHRLEHGRLSPYKTRGNEISNSLYRDLDMPWPEVPEFPEELFVRREWNVDGKVERGEKFFRGQEVVSLERFARAFATATMVTRWREAHPELADTDEDAVAVTARELREALGDRDWFEGGSATGLLIFKRI